MKKLLLSLVLASVSVLSSFGFTLSLTWDLNPAGDQVTSYRLYEKTGTPAAPVYTQVGESAIPPLRLNGVPAGPHVYVLTAVSAFGVESTYSEEASTSELKPGAPTQLHFDRTVVGQVKVSFPAEANALYDLQSSADAATWASVQTFLFDTDAEAVYIAAISPGVQLFRTESF